MSWTRSLTSATATSPAQAHPAGKRAGRFGAAGARSVRAWRGGSQLGRVHRRPAPPAAYAAVENRG